MIRQRGLTLSEILISSTLLLLMIGMASFACVSYLKAYHRYTDNGTRLRLAAKSMETLSFRLRSVRCVYQPDHVSLERGLDLGKASLDAADDQGGRWQLGLHGHLLELVYGDEKIAVFRDVETAQLKAEPAELGTMLRVEIKAAGIAGPLFTRVSWKEVTSP